MKKNISLFMFSLLIMVGFNLYSTEVQASTNLDSNFISNEGIEIIAEDGTVIYFPSQKDYDDYVKEEQATIHKSGDISTRAIAFYTRSTLISKERKNMLFVGYSKATPDWMMAPFYDIARGTNHKISGSYKYGGLTIDTGFSKSLNVSTRLSADSKRYSKLAGYADITFEKYRIDRYESGTKISTRYELKKKVHNTYLKVKYQ